MMREKKFEQIGFGKKRKRDLHLPIIFAHFYNLYAMRDMYEKSVLDLYVVFKRVYV